MNRENRIICQNCGHYKKMSRKNGDGVSLAICEDYLNNTKMTELENSPIYKTLKEKVKELENKLIAKEPDCIYQDEPLCPSCGELLDLCDWQCKCGQVLDLSSW